MLDLEELEELCGLVEAGLHLPTILESKTSPPFHELELGVWTTKAADRPAEPRRPAMVEARFETATQQVLAAVDFSAGLPQER